MALTAFGVFWVYAIVFSLVLLPIVRVVSWRRTTYRVRVQWLVARGFRLVHFLLNALHLFRVELLVGGQLPPPPAVIVANHPTYLDVTALISHFDGICCLVRANAKWDPLLALPLHGSGHIPVGPNVQSFFDAARERLSNGHYVLVFPEGSRSPADDLRPFQRGAFELARRQRVPLVPVAMHCEPRALSKGARLLDYPLTRPTLSISIEPAIAPETIRRDSAAVVREQLKRRLASLESAAKSAG